MRKNVLLIIVLMLSLITIGCAKISDFPGSAGLNTSGTTGESNPAAPDNNTAEEEKVTADPMADADMNSGEISGSIADANRGFSWNLFRKLNAEDSAGNIFISPLSVSSALTMALNGAEGNTRTEMERMLCYEGLTREKLNQDYANETKRLSGLDKKVTLKSANSMWIRNNYEVKKSFIDLNRSYLEAEVQTVDFSTPSTADLINGWVSKNTNHLIRKIVSPPIPPETVMYLINAIYFMGEWTTEFKGEYTQEKDFHALDGKTDRVSMMQRNGEIDYYSNEEIQAVRLPYGSEKVSMVLVMPERDINDWIGSMSTDQWTEIMENFRPVSDLELKIPKFKMEYGIKELKGVLNELGMKEAFSELADFSGIGENICISSVLHKAVIDVNEKGTEAAAVTSVEFQATSFREPVVFNADRPFFFAIVDNEEGTLLFMGKKVNGERN